MKNKIFLFTTIFIIIFNINSYAFTTIYPINGSYKEGIYKIDKNDPYTYNIQYTILNKDKNFSIIILDENNTTVYSSTKCINQCNLGNINNKNTLIIISTNEVFLYFKKIE